MPPSRLRTVLPPSLSRKFTHTSLRRQTTPFPIIPTCPPSTCACAPTPPNLDIDHTLPLANTIAPYNNHFLISTGQTNWPSRIDKSESTWSQFAAELKDALGPKGEGFDARKATLINTSSFGEKATADEGELLLFPAFRHYRNLDFPSSSILPAVLQAMKGPDANGLPYTPITNPTVLICSHYSRDSRCGVLGPLLQQEFATQLTGLGVTSATTTFVAQARAGQAPVVNLGCVSHVGGHRWAGNVIIYTPKETSNQLAGTGVWYGRVEPKHVQGIIRDTLLRGSVIGELFRGGIGKDGSVMRL